MILDCYIVLILLLRYKWFVILMCIVFLVIIVWIVLVISCVCIFVLVYFINEVVVFKYFLLVFLVMFEFVLCILFFCFILCMVYIVWKRWWLFRIIEDLFIELRLLNLWVYFWDDGCVNYNIKVVVFVVGLFILCYLVDVYISFCDNFSLFLIFL